MNNLSHGEHDAVSHLLRAYDEAQEWQVPLWEFALEVRRLHTLGPTDTLLRRLVQQRFAEHAVEVTRPQDGKRRFRKLNNLSFPEGTCLVLTAAGAAWARSLGSDPPGVPRWDAERRQLWWGDVLVKEFRRSSPNQETILAAFQEEDWPAHLDDPLTPRPGRDSRARLRDALKNLNRAQANHLLRFWADGQGQGIYWQKRHG